MGTTTRRLGLLVALLLASSNVVYAAPVHAGAPAFRVSGRDVIGPDGAPVVLRGVNKSGLEYSPWGYDLSFATFQRMKRAGVNVVRLPLAPPFATKGMCDYTPSYLSTVDRIVGYGEKLKLLIVLDDHFGTAGRPCGTGRWINNHKAPDVFNLAFVKALGSRYRGRTYVAIDLYNEPHDATWDVWRKGGRVDNYVAVGMQQMLDTVRSTGFGGLVFATGPSWGNDLRELVVTPLDNDVNVVYAAHAYPVSCNGRMVPPAEPYLCQGRFYPPFVHNWIAPLAAKRPVVLTEFGTNRALRRETAALVQWADSVGIGWTAWLWCRGRTSDFCLMAPDGSPSTTGQPIFEALAAPH